VAVAAAAHAMDMYRIFTKEYKSRCAKGGRGGHGVSNWMAGRLGNDGQKGQDAEKYTNIEGCNKD